MILGIALVVNELHKGQKMVFRYPESIPSTISNEPSRKGLIKLYKEYFSLSQENFAKLFRSKNSLCHKVLELSIGDLSFISYPCPCHSDEDHSTDTNVTRSAHGESSNQEVITFFNVVITSVSLKTLVKLDRNFIYKCQTKFSSISGEDPIAAAMGLKGRYNNLCQQTLRRLIEVISNCLLQQEKKSKYVSSEVFLLLDIIESAASVSPASSVDPADVVDVIFSRNYRSYSNSSTLSCGTNPELPDCLSPPMPLSGDLRFQLQHEDTTSTTTIEVQSMTGDSLPAERRANTDGSFKDSSQHFLNSHANNSTNIGAGDSNTGANENSGPGGDTGAGREDGFMEGTKSANWGSHVLPAALQSSALADELRILYHNLLSNHSVNIMFNGAKAVNVPLFCKDPKGCVENSSVRRGWSRQELLRARQTPPLFPAGAEFSAGIKSSPVRSNSRVVNQNTPLRNSPKVGGKSGGDTGKIKGVNLNTQTFLAAADSETVLFLLSQLDSSAVARHSASSTTTTALTEEHKPMKERRNSSKDNLKDLEILKSSLETHDKRVQGEGNDLVFQTRSGSSSGAGQGKGSVNPVSNPLVNSRLHQFLEAADPTASFLDLSLDLDEPVEELVSMASYLQHCGLAEAVPIIYSRSCYKIHPHAPCSERSRVSRAFDALLHGFGLFQSNSYTSESEQVLKGEGDNKDPRGVIKSNSEGMLSNTGLKGIKHEKEKKNENKKLQNFSQVENKSNNNATCGDNNSQGIGENKQESDFKSQPRTYSFAESLTSAIFGVGATAESNSNKIQKPKKVISEASFVPKTIEKPKETVISPPSKQTEGRNKNSLILMDLDRCSDIPSDCRLPAVLSFFNGEDSFRTIQSKLPLILHSYAVDIVVFLLRWHMILPVNTYIVNLQVLNDFHPKNTDSPSNNGLKLKKDNMGTTEEKSNNNEINDKEIIKNNNNTENKFFPEINYSSDKSRNNSLTNERKGSFHSEEDPKTNGFLTKFNETERGIYSKLISYVQFGVISNKNLAEIALVTKTAEEDLLRVVKKVPHLEIVKKINC